MEIKIQYKLTPLIQQIHQKIKDHIAQQGYKVGDKLSSVTYWATKLSVSDKTIQNVLTILRREGYISSHVGKGTFLNQPITGSVTTTEENIFSNTIAVLDGQSEVDLTCEHTESWTTRIVHGMRVEAAASKTDLLLLNNKLNSESVAEAMQKIKDKVDGVITFPFTDSDTIFNIFGKHNIPVLMINRPSSATIHNYVSADYFGGSKCVGELFAEIGCKNIWLMTTHMAGIFSKEQRYKGLAEGLKFSGHNEQIKVVIIDSATDDHAYNVTRELLFGNEKPDGIYCSGDYIAMGVMRALKDQGIPIGTKDGTSVVGSSGFEISAHTAPSLTVVQIPMIEIGRRAIRKVLDIKADKSHRSLGDILPTKLILRDSTPEYLKNEDWLKKIEDTKRNVYF